MTEGFETRTQLGRERADDCTHCGHSISFHIPGEYSQKHGRVVGCCQICNDLRRDYPAAGEIFDCPGFAFTQAEARRRGHYKTDLREQARKARQEAKEKRKAEKKAARELVKSEREAKRKAHPYKRRRK